jgi:hypothetical protein
MGIIEDLTGVKIEKKLTEYSEVYGEILVGMHREMEHHRTLIREHDENMRQGVAYVNQAQAQVSQAVIQAEAHSKDASHHSELAASAALAADGYAKECKQELEKTKEFASDVQRKWQELLLKVEGLNQELHTLTLTFKRFRTRVIWSSAAIAVVAIIGGLAWMIHCIR